MLQVQLSTIFPLKFHVIAMQTDRYVLFILGGQVIGSLTMTLKITEAVPSGMGLPSH
jgi:hypothetical protein